MGTSLFVLRILPEFKHIIECCSPFNTINVSQNDSACCFPQKHFLCTIVGPDSSYSPLEIHICWNVLNDDKIEPPIHTEYFLSGGATTLIFIVEGANAVNSFVMRSPMPENIVVPPESTTFAYKSLRMSTSHFMIDWNVVSCPC